MCRSTANDTGVFWSVERVGVLAATWRTLTVLPLSETVSVPSPLAETEIVPLYPSSVAPLVGSTAVPPTDSVPAPGPTLTVAAVAVIATDPAKFGDDVVPLPDRLAALVMTVYVPAGKAWPLTLSTPAGTVSVSETLPVKVAVKVCQLPLTPRLVSAGPKNERLPVPDRL